MQYVIAARAAQDEYEIVNLVNHESLVLSTYAVADADSRLPDSPFLRRQVEEEAHGSWIVTEQNHAKIHSRELTLMTALQRSVRHLLVRRGSLNRDSKASLRSTYGNEEVQERGSRSALGFWQTKCGKR